MKLRGRFSNVALGLELLHLRLQSLEFGLRRLGLPVSGKRFQRITAEVFELLPKQVLVHIEIRSPSDKSRPRGRAA